MNLNALATESCISLSVSLARRDFLVGSDSHELYLYEGISNDHVYWQETVSGCLVGSIDDAVYR